ncbi:hypothetical protein FA13DRAFT_1793766 [Coprinellus micaceus]|uniref:Uncharacterized protein n=1 Tax=Coprinellus micaceus TaxID=71717 RepID=A0A4Y7T4P6_COPMI|nr:hypothetical protein FA13DRAFT_1793766 [Coprinellus micaceus]
MSTTPEVIQAFADMVAMWQMQEYIFISFFAFYAYYVITTLEEEVSIIFPERWNRGAALYMVIRYGTLVYIALHLSRDYRNYFSISPSGCKALAVLHTAARWTSVLASHFLLGVCLSALLQAGILWSAVITLLGFAIPFVTAVCEIVATVQYPAQPTTPSYKVLGYPCYVPSSTQWSEQTIAHAGRHIRAYMNLAATLVLALVGVATLAVRYKGHRGQLVQVIRRDGGAYYLSLLAIRLALAVIYTPTLQSALEIDGNPVALLSLMANDIIIQILAQRLLINMRKVDYVGPESVVSKLLFPRCTSDSGDDGEEGGDVPFGVMYRT